MTDFGPHQFGKILLLTGILISLFGGLIILLSHLGLFKLPGDITLQGKNWKVYFPLATCIILSIILTLFLWLINLFKNK